MGLPFSWRLLFLLVQGIVIVHNDFIVVCVISDGKKAFVWK